MNNSNSFGFGIAVLTVTLAACGGEVPPLVVGEETAALTGGPNLLWHNAGTGELSAWILSGATVTGAQSLSTRCGSSDGCSAAWHVVDTRSNSILWFNPTSGGLSTWTFDSNGNVSIGRNLSWTCSAASGCSQAWQPIGRLLLRPASCSGICFNQSGLLWSNIVTGEVSVWLIGLDGSTVTGSQSLQARLACGPAGCPPTGWKAMLTQDFDGDGYGDALFQHQTSGLVEAWLVKDAQTPIAFQEFSASCGSSTGCSPPWTIVAGGDANGDGHADLLWHNRTAGQLLSWLLNGQGAVTDTQTLSQTCDAASGCSAAWRAVEYVTFPSPPPS